MASASFTIEGGASPQIVAASATVDLALTSVTGVRLIEWSIVGSSDSTQSFPTITLAGTPTGATASFNVGTESISGLGVSYIVQCRINGGVDDNGSTVSSYTATGIVGIENAAGILPFSVGEKFERNVTHGIADDLNASISVTGSTGTWAQVLTAGASSGATDPVISNGQVLKMGTTNPASTGQIRLRNNLSGIKWRNAAASGDIGIDLNGSNVLKFGANSGTAPAECQYDSVGSHTFQTAGATLLQITELGSAALILVSADNNPDGLLIVADTPSGGVNGPSIAIVGGEGGTGNRNGGDVYIQPGPKTGSGVDGNVGFKDAAGAYLLKMDCTSGFVELTDTATVPGTPTAAHRIYSASGALKGKGSSGTVTTIAAAEPHCPRCGKDAAHEWENTDQNWKVSMCMWCATAPGAPLADFVIDRNGA